MEAAAQNVIIVKQPVYSLDIEDTKIKRIDDRTSCRFVTTAAIR